MGVMQSVALYFGAPIAFDVSGKIINIDIRPNDVFMIFITPNDLAHRHIWSVAENLSEWSYLLGAIALYTLLATTSANETGTAFPICLIHSLHAPEI